ncbi:ribonuclease T2-like [Blyttiomyces sp. JEL0837]|nr:ribonuclease T2-like [Blyttiomyces sp. JEL0837]
MVLALQWLPGYCKATKAGCKKAVLDRVPETSWTIHGLWPNTCDNYQIYDCDRKRKYPNAEELIEDSPVYEAMKDYCSGVMNGESMELAVRKLCEHKPFSNFLYATFPCKDSLSDLVCLKDGKKGDDVVKFFNDTLELHGRFDIFDSLYSKDIIPSNIASYKEADIRAALAETFGPKMPVGLRCQGPYLSEIRIGLRGSAKDLAVVADSESFYLPSNCPRYGIVYVEGPKPQSQTRKQKPGQEPISPPELSFQDEN